MPGICSGPGGKGPTPAAWPNQDMADRSDDRARTHRNRAADLVTKPTHGRHPPTNCTAGIAIRPARLHELHCLKNKSRLLPGLMKRRYGSAAASPATLIEG